MTSSCYVSGATTVGISLTFEVPFPPILTQSEDATTRSVSSSFQNTVSSCWRHNMGTLDELLAICEGNPSVIGWFLLQSVSNSDRSVVVSLNVLTLRWRHNARYGVSNCQSRDCLLNRLFSHRSKKTRKLRATGHHKGPVTRKMFPFDDVIMNN